jgi:hypothetical protein
MTLRAERWCNGGCSRKVDDANAVKARGLGDNEIAVADIVKMLRVSRL